MRKTLLALTCVLSSLFVYANDTDDNLGWMVQIAVYNQQVPASHFMEIKDKVFYSKDKLDFHHYYVGTFSEAEANEKGSNLSDLGFTVKLVHESEFDTRCACYSVPKPRELSPSLQSIFFDFDKYSLRSESKRQLQLMAKNLLENPSYKGMLRAHTDAKGSNAYNEVLSMNRAKAAKNYLISRGVSANRIEIATFGEESPIAMNELKNGSDTEEGRQLNRRVELQILNSAGEGMNIVQDIFVPASLSTR